MSKHIAVFRCPATLMDLPSDEGNEVTEDMFSVFLQEIRYWMTRLGMLGWFIQACLEDWSDELGSEYLAATIYEIPGRSATFNLRKVWHVDPTEAMLRCCAFHEVYELFLGPVMAYTDPKHSSYDDVVNGEKHVIIRTMEKVIWEPDWQSRLEEREIEEMAELPRKKTKKGKK